MDTEKKTRREDAVGKTLIAMGLSTFYFAMLAYPFGITRDGYVVERALLAGAILFAISIPAWVINLRREFFAADSATEKERAAATATVHKRVPDIAELALRNNWLSPKEIKQILYCQEFDHKKFGEVAVKRNFLTMSQVKSLLDMQQAAREELKSHS